MGSIKAKKIKKHTPKEDDQAKAKNYSYTRDGLTYKMCAIGREKINELRPWYSDVHVSYYIPKLNFVSTFDVTSNTNNPKIDRTFNSLKKKIEKFFPDAIIIFDYPTQFILRKHKENQELSGVKVELSINLRNEFELKKGSLLAQHLLYVNLLTDAINAEIENLFK
jgi:hypothetical protein